jgi:hypothetical protein
MHVKFQVLTVVEIRITVFWDVSPCSLVHRSNLLSTSSWQNSIYLHASSEQNHENPNNRRHSNPGSSDRQLFLRPKLYLTENTVSVTKANKDDMIINVCRFHVKRVIFSDVNQSRNVSTNVITNFKYKMSQQP